MKPGDKLVSQTGEFNLIDRIRNIFPATVHSDILVGMGDDTAVLRLDDDRVLLVTCDIQIEDRHFRQDFISAYQLGRRSIAVNISDIAAMGGKPTFALASLGLPEGMTVREYDNLFQGMRDELQQHGAALIGGNLARSENKLIVDITLLGEVSKSGYVTREGAREGDGVYVTGVVGASGSGLEVLKKFGQNYPEKYRQLVEAHLLP
ncbi:MAG: thiamine-monophosphate kinase, partial [Calditrichaeota bacterium]|nr:thiamine-monophosphate kinase [Calditrichota bacterium]